MHHLYHITRFKTTTIVKLYYNAITGLTFS